MAGSLLLNTSTPTFGEVFANGKTFAVPRFQRNYAWDVDQWEELWEDLMQCLATGQDHYMGAIVLKTVPERRHFEVIDGQQRLVTLSLLVLAAIALLDGMAKAGVDAADNQQRAQLFRDRFLSTRDPASLTYSSRLQLNEHNHPFYQSNLLQLRKPVAPSRLSDSDKLLWKGFQYFEQRLNSQLAAVPDRSVALAKLIEVAADRLLFIQIQVSDELDAYTVFETLNARGTQLTITDLLKNYVFSRFAGSHNDLRVADIQWSRIVGNKEAEFAKLLRYFWSSHHGVTRPPRLFKSIRERVRSNIGALRLLDDLERAALINNALTQPADEFWADKPRDMRESAGDLLLLKVTQCYPMLYACWETCPDLFADALRICVVISFRYVVIGRLNTQPMERAYVNAAVALRRGEIASAPQIFAAVKALYVSDDQFEADFGRAVVPTTRDSELVRYILYRIENHLGSGSRPFASDNGSVEHILPENPDDAWMQAVPEFEANVYRLGNYTLLEPSLNRQAERQPIDTKRKIYATSAYRLSNQFGWSQWTQTQILARQQWMAKQAVACWRLPF